MALLAWRGMEGCAGNLSDVAPKAFGEDGHVPITSTRIKEGAAEQAAALRGLTHPKSLLPPEKQTQEEEIHEFMAVRSILCNHHRRRRFWGVAEL